ncbi:hypothetical protein [Psychrobacter sp. PG1]|uniref:hypothetical protein n=1 Tax=unclassified Psychrobacter TaxID=196806 RepID=UPI001869573E|nr:hypothetical protein [Psychrobacter sp. PG1]
MAVIGFLLIFVLPLVFLYSLFKPKIFSIRTKKNSTGRWSRIQSVVVFAVIWFLGVVMLVEGDSPEDSTVQSDGVVAAESAQKEPSRKERKAAEKAAKEAEKAEKEAAKEAELAKEDVQRQSTLIGNSSTRPILSNGWSRMDIYTNCQILIQNSLKSPKSFDSSIRTVKFIRDAEEEIIGVNFDFYATNSFGAELIHSGTCVYDLDGKLLEYDAKAK